MKTRDKLGIIGIVIFAVLEFAFIGWIIQGRYDIVDTWDLDNETRWELLDVSSDKVTDEK